MGIAAGASGVRCLQEVRLKRWGTHIPMSSAAAKTRDGHVSTYYVRVLTAFVSDRVLPIA